MNSVSESPSFTEHIYLSIHVDLILNLSPFLSAASYEKSVITNAMSTFHSKTCIRFVARSTQTDYISIENKDGWEQ